MEQFGSLQIIEIVRRVFDLIRLARALMNKSAHLVRIQHASGRTFSEFVIPIESRVAGRDEMFPAKSLALEKRGNRPVTIRDSAMCLVRHFASQ